MSGQLVSTSGISLGIAGLAVATSWAIGITDAVRQPRWAWRAAGRSQLLNLASIAVLPVVGFVAYVFNARPSVVAVASAGRAASLPLDGLGEPAPCTRPVTGSRTVASWPRFGSFGAAAAPVDHLARLDATLYAAAPVPVGTRTATTLRTPLGADVLCPDGLPSTIAVTVDPSVPAPPAGWRTDPTGRHQFRYWDGARWTDTAADGGVRTSDPIRA
jgi:hypothetical protein